MIRTTLAEIERYYPLSDGIKTAADFIRNNDLASFPAGRYAVDGDRIFALVQELETKPADEALIENHIRSIDMQMTLRGNESVAYRPVAKLTKKGEYDAAADVQNYSGETELIMRNDPGASVSIFFPEDGHQPYIAEKSPEPIKKSRNQDNAVNFMLADVRGKKVDEARAPGKYQDVFCNCRSLF